MEAIHLQIANSVVATTVKWAAVFAPSITVTLWLTTKENGYGGNPMVLVLAKVFAVLSCAFLLFVTTTLLLTYLGMGSQLRAIGAGWPLILSVLISAVIVGVAQNMVRIVQGRPTKPIFSLNRLRAPDLPFQNSVSGPSRTSMPLNVINVRRWILAFLAAGLVYLIFLVLTLDLGGLVVKFGGTSSWGRAIGMSSPGMATLSGTIAGVVVAPRRQWRYAASVFAGLFIAFAIYLFIGDSIDAGALVNFSEAITAVIGGGLAYAFLQKLFAKKSFTREGV